jgi:tight adherence protein B
MSPGVLAAVVFASAAIVFYLILQFMQGERIVRQRMAQMRGVTAQSPPPQQPRVDSEDRLPTVTRIISGMHFTERLLLALVKAGLKLRPSEFIGIVAAFSIGLMMISIAMLNSVWAIIPSLFLGIAVPTVYLNVLQKRRITQFNKQIPDALSLMSSSLRTGYSFQRAMQMVSDEMANPISEEFKRTLDETNVGVSLEVALQHLLMRVQSYDLELVVTAVMIQQQIGGNLAEVLDNIANTIRERVRVEGEVAALTAEGKMSGIVLVGLPFLMAFILTIMNPGYLSPLGSESFGRALVFLGLCLQFLGAVIIRRIITLDF